MAVCSRDESISCVKLTFGLMVKGKVSRLIKTGIHCNPLVMDQIGPILSILDFTEQDVGKTRAGQYGKKCNQNHFFHVSR